MLSQTLVENDHSINDVCRTANIWAPVSGYFSAIRFNKSGNDLSFIHTMLS